MAGQDINTDKMKELPYYKSIVKYILQQQVHQLLEEMFSEVGEESLIMTVNPQNGTISHHGSKTGKTFLQARSDLKTQFLTFCVTNNSQVSSSNYGQISGLRKRKSTINDSTSPVKIQRKATSITTEGLSTQQKATEKLSGRSEISYKHPYSLRRTERSINVKSLFKKLTFNRNTSKKSTENQNMYKKATSNQNMCKKTTPDENVSLISKNTEIEIETTNHNNLRQISPIQPQLSSSASGAVNLVENLNPEDGFIAQQVMDGHSNSMDLNDDQTSRPVCSDKDSLTNYYYGFSTDVNQPLTQEGFKMKQEEEISIEYVPFNEVTIDSVNSIRSRSHEDSYIGSCGPSESTHIQLNGTDINFKIPALQPFVRLETFNPLEKQITDNQSRINTGLSLASTGFSGHVDQSHNVENCQQLSGDLDAIQTNISAVEGLDTSCEASNLLINGDTMKEEKIGEENDSFVTTLRKSEFDTLTNIEGILVVKQDDSSNNGELTRKQDTKASRNQEANTKEQNLVRSQQNCIANSPTDFIIDDVKVEEASSEKMDVTRNQESEKSRNEENEKSRNKEINTKESTRMDAPTAHAAITLADFTHDDDDAFEDTLIDQPDYTKIQEKTQSRKEEVVDLRNQEIMDSRNQEIMVTTNQKMMDSTNQEIMDSRNQEIMNSRNQEIMVSTNQKMMDSTNKEIIMDQTKQVIMGLTESTTDYRNHQNIKKSHTDFLEGGVTLDEVDDDFGGFEIFECVSSGSEWKNSDDEDSSSDDEQILDDEINREVVANSKLTNHKRTEESTEYLALKDNEEVKDRLKQKKEALIYDDHGNILGRKIKDEDMIKCIRNNGIYIKKFKKNPNSKYGRKYDDNFHLCIYCKKVTYTPWKHLPRVHKNEAAVKEILDLKTDLKYVDDADIKCKMEKMIAIKQQLLRRKSNHEHNLKVMKEKRGELILAQNRLHAQRHGKRDFNSELYGYCPDCFDWMELKIGYARHRQVCLASNKNSLSDTLVQNFVIQGKILASISKDMQKEVFPLMPNDRLAKTAKSDPLIVALGEYHLMNRHGRIERRGYYASYRMRVAARLVHIFRKEKQLETLSLSDCLKVEHFNLVAKCAIQTASKNSQKEFQHSKFGKQLGIDLFSLISAKIGSLRRDHKTAELEDAKKFHSLLQEKWLHTVQAQYIIIKKEKKSQQKMEEEASKARVKALLEKERGKRENNLVQQSLEENHTSHEHGKESIVTKDKQFGEEFLHLHCNSSSKQKLSEGNKEASSEHINDNSNEVGTALEENLDIYEKCDPGDFVRLSRYLTGELEKFSELEDVSTPEKYRFMVSVVLGDLVLYNSCAAEKIQFLKLETFRRKLRIAGESQVSSFLEITDLERELLKTHDLIEYRAARSKRQMESRRLQGHKFPIILPAGMSELLRQLADCSIRKNCFVESENDYLFATFDSELEPLDLQSALDAIRDKAELNKPLGITVKNLKKYTSTICQVSSLTEERLLQFVQDIGLIEKLNLEEGQSISGVKDRLEIAKLIFLQEQGKTEKLRTLQEISFDEIEGEQETKDTSTLCDFITDEEEEEDIGVWFPKKQRKKKSNSKGVPVRVPWSKVENEEIHKYFEHYIALQSSRACPGMNEILTVCKKSKQTHGEIWKRDWIAIKSKVANMMKKSKKKFHSDGDESDN